MTLDINRRRIPREDEELALDRPSRDPAPLDRRGRYDSRDEDRVVVRPARTASNPLEWVSRGIGLLAKLTLLLILLAVLWGIVSFMSFAARAPGSLGEQVSTAIERSAGVVSAIAQRASDALDPAHPPRSALAQDVEIDELLRLDVGKPLPNTTTHAVTLASVQRRPGAEGPDAAVYAVLHSELRTPQETKVLGVTVHSSTDPRDYYLYKGETIRIGRKLYKVNWVSVERQQLALIAYREQDRVTAPLKVELD